MTKIIVVRGVGNSGKSSSIRTFIEQRNIHHMQKGDLTLTIPVQKNNRDLLIGVATGGDTVRILEQNFSFFDAHKLDFIVCATKSIGDTVGWMECRPEEKEIIRTKKLYVPKQEDLLIQWQAVAEKIWKTID